MERFAKRRFAALLLALLLAAASVLPAAAAAEPPESVSFTEVSPPADAAPPPYHQLVARETDINALALNDEPLRVLIELEKPSLMEKGYSAADLAADSDAAAYNRELWQDQDAVIKAIEAATGEPLDVVWRLTIVANLLSARVLPAQTETIAAVPGVRSVQEEAVAVPLEADGEDAETTEPDRAAEDADSSGETDTQDAGRMPGSEADTEEAGSASDAGSTPGNEADAAGTEPAENGSEASHDAAPGDAAGGSGPAESVPAEGATVAAEPGSGTPVVEDTGDGTAGDEALPAAQADEPAGPAGYNGAGQRIAIIDTGTDEWHRSLNSGAWMYALQQNADAAGKTLAQYIDPLDLLDEAGIAAVLPNLTIVQRLFDRSVYDPTDPAYGSAEAEQKRAEIAKGLAGHGEAAEVGDGADARSLRKVAFGANYSASGRYNDIAHHDRVEHGSHVAGIAAANRYVPDLKCWDPATGELTTDTPEYELLPTVTVQKEGSEETKTATVRGQAPDAQLLVMQVFSEYGCAESDYMAAIQDALLLGADAVNLSLGSSEPGATFALNSAFQSVINRLVDSGAVVAAAHGNSYHWTWPNLPTETYPAELPALPYADDVVFDTGGTPSTYDTFLAVAAADTGGEAPRMASYSSWGVPSSLELKPEITASGTDIDSLNGAHGDPEEGADVRHDKYEEMSGTSMATPQIAGMAALVTEYLKNKYPDLAGDGNAAKRRHIAQSLLMSTAVPMKYPDDPETYYSVLWQGAGLADAGKAVSTDAYIMMGTDAVFRARTAEDGKVKAELGADADGTFQFTFTVHDLAGDGSRQYRLHTDLFTQGLTTCMGAASLDTKTARLPGTVSYTSTGSSPGGDGFSITVPENGSVEVTVDIRIDALDPALYPAGAFVEGYTWVEKRTRPPAGTFIPSRCWAFTATGPRPPCSTAPPAMTPWCSRPRRGRCTACPAARRTFIKTLPPKPNCLILTFPLRC